MFFLLNRIVSQESNVAHGPRLILLLFIHKRGEGCGDEAESFVFQENVQVRFRLQDCNEHFGVKCWEAFVRIGGTYS